MRLSPGHATPGAESQVNTGQLMLCYVYMLCYVKSTRVELWRLTPWCSKTPASFGGMWAMPCDMLRRDPRACCTTHTCPHTGHSEHGHEAEDTCGRSRAAATRARISARRERGGSSSRPISSSAITFSKMKNLHPRSRTAPDVVEKVDRAARARRDVPATARPRRLARRRVRRSSRRARSRSP